MGSSPNAKEMLATVRAWLAQNYPGCSLECVKIRIHGIKKSIRIYESPVQVPVAIEVSVAKPLSPPTRQVKPLNDEETVIENSLAGDGEHCQDERGAGLAPCACDILATLRESDRPMTKAILLEQMGMKNREWSERTVDKYLQSLMEDGTIENPPDSRPRGYRFSE